MILQHEFEVLADIKAKDWLEWAKAHNYNYEY